MPKGAPDLLNEQWRPLREALPNLERRGHVPKNSKKKDRHLTEVSLQTPCMLKRIANIPLSQTRKYLPSDYPADRTQLNIWVSLAGFAPG